MSQASNNNNTNTTLFTISGHPHYNESKYTAFHFFYETEDVFSQWHPAKFTYQYDDTTVVEFTCAEHMMMYEKAKLFGDTDSMRQLLQTKDPRKQKAIGRRVSPFDHDMWERNKQDIVYRTNRAKFTQNPALLQELLSPQYVNKEFVEASPTDTIWGIGLSTKDPGSKHRNRWRGQNLLGKVLTCLRDDLLAEQKQQQQQQHQQ